MTHQIVTTLILLSIAASGCASSTPAAVVVAFENHDPRQVIDASDAALAWIVDHGYGQTDHALAVDSEEPAASARWAFAAFGHRTVAVTPFARPGVLADSPSHPVVVGAWATCRGTPLEPQYQSAESAAWTWIAALEHALGTRAELLVDRASANDARRLNAARAMLRNEVRAGPHVDAQAETDADAASPPIP